MSSEVSKGFKGSETCQGWPPWANGVMPRHQDLDPGIPRAVNAVKSVAKVGTHKEQEYVFTEVDTGVEKWKALSLLCMHARCMMHVSQFQLKTAWCVCFAFYLYK